MHRKDKISLFLMAMIAAFAAGCGGGQSSTGPSSAHTQTSKVGEAVVTFSGQPKPQLSTSSSYVAVVGQAGATFSTVTLEPPPKLDDTYLVLGRFVGADEALYMTSYPSGTSQVLYQDSGNTSMPTVSGYGTIAFKDYTTTGGLKSIRQDGTGLTSINFTGLTTPNWPRYATDGTNRLAFQVGSSLYVGPGTGGTATAIQTNDFGQGVAWSPSGSQIMYSATVSGGLDLFVTSDTGGTAMDVTPTALKGTGSFTNPTWSSDGVSAAAMYLSTGGSDWEIIRFNVTNPATYLDVTPTGDSDIQPAFSPDGSKLAVYRTGAGSGSLGIYVEDTLGLNQSILSADPSGNAGGGDGALEWSPFLPKETVVSATASTFYHSAASGFLLSQGGDQFGSFIAFTAATPSTAAIQTPTSNYGTAPLVFTITADSITSIGYINNYFNTGTTVSLTSTPSVVLTVDAATGQVDIVAPASEAKPSLVKNADGTLTYKATFKAVYDGTGRNLAPNGASNLTFDPKTGKLVAFK